jgi:phage terminase small subunit
VPLTAKQKLFVSYYLGKARGNATEAARLAGYGSPRQAGTRALSNASIREAIDLKLDRKAMEVDEILARLTQQATVSMADFWRLGDAATLPVLDLAKAQKLGLMHLVREMKVTKDGEVQVKLYDAQKALELLGRYRGLWQPDLKLGPVEVIVTRVKPERSEPD